MEDKKIICEEAECKESFLNRLRAILERREIIYWNDPKYSNVIAAGVGSEKFFTVKFVALEDYVQPFVEFPFRVQSNTTAIMALYLADYNHEQMDEQRGKMLYLNADMGKIILTYGFGVKCPDFNKESEEEIWEYVSELIEAGEDVYTCLNQLAVGKTGQTLRRLYLMLLEKAVKVLQGREEKTEEVTYGIKKLKEDAKDPFCLMDERARRLGMPTYREFLAMRRESILQENEDEDEEAWEDKEEKARREDDEDESVWCEEDKKEQIREEAAAEQEREADKKSGNHVRLTLADFLKNTLNTETLPEVKIEDVPDAGEDEFWK